MAVGVSFDGISFDSVVVHYIRDLGYIVYYSSLTGMFTVWCGLRYACFGLMMIY